MRFVLPGGSGQVGQVLARAFAAEGHDVVVLARRLADSSGRVVQWDGETIGPWATELDGADVVITVPRLLLDRGFTFRFPDWPSASRDLVGAWRRQRGR